MSQDQSFCKWAWCRSTFSNNAGLVHHVVHNHVCRAIPVRRRDIPMIKRAEEGQGESLKISQLMVDLYSYGSRESISHKSVEPPQEPSSSLPSPPASSPALHSLHHIGHSVAPVPSPSPQSLEHGTKPEPRNPDISQSSPYLTSSKPSQGHNPPSNQIPSFASLSSLEPQCPPFLFEIPDSPSFSSLVERPNKRKITYNIADNMSGNKTHAVNQPHLLSPSHSSSTSFDSQISVEAQLTQTEQDDDVNQDVLGGEDLNLRNHLSYGFLSDLTSQSQSNSYHHLEDLPIMSQPPSQLRLDSEFPFHSHDRPRGSGSHTGLDPSVAMPLSPLSPSSPTFAVSTPVRQNWYQPPLKRRKRSTYNDKSSDPSPVKVEEASVSSTKSKNVFRSGTLQITSTSLPKESTAKHAVVDTLHMENCQNDLVALDDLDTFSQSSQDSSNLSESISYPALQTQAPYQSQSLTQF